MAKNKGNEFEFLAHLCHMLSLGPHVCLVIFVMSESNLCRNKEIMAINKIYLELVERI